MPQCDGRATEAGITLQCPDCRNDATVRLCHDNLMLCKACCDFRFPINKTKVTVMGDCETTAGDGSPQNDTITSDL